MKKIIIALLMLSILSCNKDESNEKDYTARCLYFTISVCDKDGNNLLDPNNKNSFAHDKIKCYEINNNGEKIYEDVRITKSTSGFYYIGLHAGYGSGGISNNRSRSTSIIELSEGNIEKIEHEIEYSENAVHLDKLWYKGKKVYDRSILDTEPDISIIR
jgi:hypothetical protein